MGFEKNALAFQQWQERKRVHEQIVKNWRTLEDHCATLTQHSPTEYMMIRFDDTTPVRLPHFGNREYKKLASKVKHLEFVPWLVEDVGRRKKYYVYSLQNAPGFQKGGNRWCVAHSHRVSSSCLSC